MKRTTTGIILILSLAIISSCTRQKPVDMIVINARIYTVDAQNTITEAMAVAGGNIIALGNKKELLSKYTGKIYDAGGKTVYPGFMDAHCHFYGYGITKLRYCDLTGTNSWQEILERLAAFRRQHPDNAWLTGRGWDQNDWEDKAFPDRTTLDSLFPDIPVLLIRIDGHAVIVNRKVLDIAGFGPDTKIAGGEPPINETPAPIKKTPVSS